MTARHHPFSIHAVALAAMALLLSSCLGDKFAGGSSSTETGTEIQLVGRVVDGDNKGVAGVVVTLSRVGLTDTTDSQGQYRVEGEPDSVVVENGVLDTLVFRQEENEVATLPVTKWVDNLPDIKIVQRDISGTLLESSVDIARVEAVISGEGIPEDQPVVIDLFHFSLTSTYTGFAYFRGTTGVVNYAVYVRVLDSLGRMTGRSPLVEFQSNAGNIPIPDFNPGNAIPVAFAGRDTMLGVNDTLRRIRGTVGPVNSPLLLHGLGEDVFDGSIVKWEWDIGGTGNFIVTSSGDTTITLPSDTSLGSPCVLTPTPSVSGGSPLPPFCATYPSILRVTDDDGNTAVDTFLIRVVRDPPIPTLEGPTTIKVGALATFTSQVAQQFGNVEMYMWDDGKGEGWVDSAEDMSQIAFTYEAKGDYTIRLYVRDDDGNKDSTSRSISVGNDNPIISGMRDTTFSINDSINMVFAVTATDPEGIKWYLWDMNGDGTNEDTTLTNTNTLSFSSPTPTVRRVTVTVWDNFDGVSSDTAAITVALDPPAPTIQGPTTVKVGVAATLTAQVTQQFGHIVMYKWDDGKSVGWTDSSSSLSLFSSTYQTKGTYTTRLYVRDDDGNVDSATKIITVTNDDPVISRIRDTIVPIQNDKSLSFTITASDPEGIKKVLWDFGGDGLDIDTVIGGGTTFISTKAYDVYSSVPNEERVVITVHDNFDGVSHDTVTIFSMRGTAWTVRKSSGPYLSSVIWTGNLFVAVGFSGTILTSPDGVTWTDRASESLTNFKSLVWTGSKVVAVGYHGDSRTISTSSDGVTWTSQTTPSSVSLNSVVWTGDQLVAVGYSGCILTSPNGETWTVQASGTVSDLSSLVWTGSRLLAGGPAQGDAVGTLTSLDGVTWIQSSEEISPSLVSVAWGGDWLVGVGFNFSYNNSAISNANNGVIRVSSNGSDWDTQQVSPVSTLVTWDGNQFTAVGDDGSVRVSLNGVTWLDINSGTTVDLRSVVWNGSQYVAVGANGIILTSP